MSKSITLGRRLKYPITITKLLKRPGDELKKGEPVFSYTFTWMQEVGDPLAGETWTEEQTTPADWDSNTDGTLKQWKINEGDVIPKDMAFAEVEEECPHSVQFGGMCALCGLDMTRASWAAEGTDADRAQINMIHDQTKLTVSREEAAKAEGELQRRLLKSRKLSLVVDLDQTIIQACIEPTIGEWQNDPNNPNHEAVKDVRAFQLADDGIRGLTSGCWYYIKMRPGLAEFLEHMSKLYELHVYTMGTRAYALNIAKIVDPNKRFFGDRIISRDENGNMTAKSLSRLFPVDTKMVLIMDDRADVWPKNRSNLIKVVPFDFFIGSGDINSSFLPKRQEIPIAPAPTIDPTPPTPISEAASPPESTEPKTEPMDAEPIATPGEGPNASDGERVSALEELVAMGGSDDPRVRKIQVEQQEELLEKQIKDRPLLHLQQKLDAEDIEATGQPTPESTDQAEIENIDSKHARHHILDDSDRELFYLKEHLTAVHQAFYDEYDRTLTGVQGGRIAELRPGANKKLPIKDTSAELQIVPDIGLVMSKLKTKVLGGTVIVLSGIVPIGIDVLSAEISQQAISFGARIETRVTNRVTHVVVAPTRTRTQKVRQALRYPHINIVSSKWLVDCMSQWERLAEARYLVETPRVRPEMLQNSQQTDDFAEERDSELDDDDSALQSFDEDSFDNDLVPDDDLTSPIDDLKTFDWDDADKELNEFLASGSEDDSDNESITSKSSRQSTASPEKKRRLPDTEDNETGDESALVKRQRIARNRSTGLKTVKVNDSPRSESSLPTPDGTGGEDGEDGDTAVVGEEENGFGDDDDLEAQMLAEFEKVEEEQDARA